MAKRSQHDSEEERVTAKSRPMMNLIARAPSHVTSSTSVSPVKRSYGSQDPWSSIAKKEERPGRDPLSAATERPHLTIVMNNLSKVLRQQVTQNGMTTALGPLKWGKLILSCANDRGDPM